MRRPLRFLAHKLDLDEKQVTELARILDELKIERALLSYCFEFLKFIKSQKHYAIFLL